MNNTRQGFKFTITTGRNFAEFETMAELARDRKAGLIFKSMVVEVMVDKINSRRISKNE